MLTLLLLACTSSIDTGSAAVDSAGDTAVPGPTPWADAVEHVQLGEGSGHGADGLPGVVLGAPGGGGGGGSLDVLSLGDGGSITVAFVDALIIDGDGPDLVVFENPFPGWTESGMVEVSADGVTFFGFACDPDTGSGCAGFTPTGGDVRAADFETWGGDAFDLADLGLDEVRFVRVTDTGANTYDGVAGGFDLDAVGAIHQR